jgi:chemotaxis protein MotB
MRWMKPGLICLLAIALTSGCMVSKKVYTQLLSQKTALDVEKDRLEMELAETRDALATARQALADTEKALSDLRTRSEKETGEQKNRILSLEREVIDLKAKYIDDMEVAEAKQSELSKSIQVLEQESSEESRILLAQLQELRDKYDRDLRAKNTEMDVLKAEHRGEVEALNNQLDQMLQIHNASVDELQRKIRELETVAAERKKSVDLLSSQADQLEQQLKEEIEKGEIRLKRFKTKTIINIDNSICFDSGSAVLKRDVKKSLRKIAETLQNFPEHDVQIEGHTDNVPIHTERFPSNWELSSARALAVLQFINGMHILAPERLSAAGYGEYHPIAPNDSGENRRLNRRVDIVILPKLEKTGGSSVQ